MPANKLHQSATLQASLEPSPYDLRAQAAVEVPTAGAVGVAGVVRSVEARGGTSEEVRAYTLGRPAVMHWMLCVLAMADREGGL